MNIPRCFITYHFINKKLRPAKYKEFKRKQFATNFQHPFLEFNQVPEIIEQFMKKEVFKLLYISN